MTGAKQISHPFLFALMFCMNKNRNREKGKKTKHSKAYGKPYFFDLVGACLIAALHLIVVHLMLMRVRCLPIDYKLDD